MSNAFTTTPRKPVVTARESIKIGVMRDMIPLTAEEHGQRSQRSFTPVVSTDRFGFQSVRAGWELTEYKARGIVVSVPTEGQDVAERVEGGWRNYNGHKVRTTSMEDRPLGGLPKPKPDDHPDAVKERKLRSASRKSAGLTQSEDRVKISGPSDAELRLVAETVLGRKYTGPIDRRMRTMILDVISHRESVAKYTQK